MKYRLLLVLVSVLSSHETAAYGGLIGSSGELVGGNHVAVISWDESQIRFTFSIQPAPLCRMLTAPLPAISKRKRPDWAVS